MDTTTVNYAIEKLNEAFQAIKPTAVELGSEYVGYMVLRATLLPCILASVFAIAAAVFIWGMKQECHPTNVDLSDFARILGGAVSTALFIPLLITTYIAILANAYPLMYTIEQLAK